LKYKTDPKLDFKMKIQKSDELLLLSFNEIVRQVTFHCQERGELLMQVFLSYFTIIRKIINIVQSEKEEI
jgi:hypothetical protein